MWQVNHVHEILPALQTLRANQSLARGLARAARRFAHRALRFESVLGYFRQLLGALAARRAPGRPVELAAGFRRVRSKEELMSFTGLCDCDAPEAPRARAGAAVPCGHRDVCCYGYNCPTRRLGCRGAAGAAAPRGASTESASPAR